MSKTSAAVKVRYKRLDKELPLLPMLTISHKGEDACYDVYVREDTKIFGTTQAVVNFGFALELPRGWEAVIRSRSGWSKRGVLVIHGTIDSGYRGEVGCVVYNTTKEIMTLSRGTKIAQLAIRQAPDIEFEEVQELSVTSRGEDGWGSTGH